MRATTILICGVVAWMVAGLMGCVSTDYTGSVYEPTVRARVYYDPADVRQDYEVMGRITAEAPEGWDELVGGGAMQDKLIEQAMAKGADGVIVYRVGNRVVGHVANTYGDSYGYGYGDAYADDWGNVYYDQGYDSGYGSTTVATEVRNKVIEAELIKYR